MRRFALALGLILAGSLVALAGSAPVAAYQGLISGGVINEGSDSRTYLYGELVIAPGATTALHYTDEYVTLHGWFGQGEGVYGEAEWLSHSTGSPITVEFGVWRQIRLTDVVSLKAWVGIQSVPHGSSLWLSANGELRLRVSEAAVLIAGSGMTLFKSEGRSFNWIGFGVTY